MEKIPLAFVIGVTLGLCGAGLLTSVYDASPIFVSVLFLAAVTVFIERYLRARDRI